MTKVKYLILGAGISGLSFANYLDSKDYIILEKENEPGGLCRTHKIDEYVWDYAGHFFHFKNEDSKNFFKPTLNNEKCVEQIKTTKIYFKNNYIDYPFQKNIHQLEKEDFIDCLYYLFFKNEKEDYSSFKDMLFGKFGKGICERFLIPYNEKLYACDLDYLDKDAMGRFFPYANIEDIIKNMKNKSNSSYNDTFIYPINGAQTVISYLMSKLEKSNVHLNEEVIDIDVTNKIVKTKNETYKFEYLINSIPFNIFNKLCNGEELELSWNRVLVFNIGFDLPAIDKTIHWIYFPEKEYNFYRVGFYNNILKKEKLSIYVEIGFNKDEPINIDEQYQKTLENLKKCGIIENHKVVAKESILMDPAYVHISNKSNEDVSKVIEKLSQNNVYTIGRYGSWTYSSMEDCYMQAKNLAYTIGKENI